MRIERDSSAKFDDVSAIYATGAFLCSCFCTQVMSNYPAIEKKFPLDKISQRLVIQRTWAGVISLFKYFHSLLPLGSGVREPGRLDWAPESCTEA